jgi:O-antigen ligase
MPTYFALEISQSIPLLTVGRILLILLFMTAIYKKRARLTLIKIDQRIILYFVIILFVDIIHIVDSGSYAIKDLLCSIIEQFMIYWTINICVNTKEKFMEALKLIFYSSACVAIVSIIGFLLKTNLFYALNTVQRTMLMTANTDIGTRAGIMRLEAGFGHPIYYALYCTMMIFIGIYFIMVNNSIINFACLMLDVIALLLTNSRGCILGCILGGAISLLLSKRHVLKKYIKLITGAIFLGVIAILLVTPIRDYIVLIFKSTIIYFSGFEKGAISNYGANSSFSNDRLMQFTGFIWTFINKPIFGFGPEANSRGLIYYFFNGVGVWSQTNSFDIGYVAIVCQYGLLGLLGFGMLYSMVFKKSRMKYLKHDMLVKFMRDGFIAYFICMFSSVSVDRIFWVMFSMMMTYCDIVKKEQSGRK